MLFDSDLAVMMHLGSSKKDLMLDKNVLFEHLEQKTIIKVVVRRSQRYSSCAKTWFP